MTVGVVAGQPSLTVAGANRHYPDTNSPDTRIWRDRLRARAQGVAVHVAPGSLHIYQQRINRVLDHIAAHPPTRTSVASLARVAVSDLPSIDCSARWSRAVYAHVRRVRLERAVFRLAHGPKAPLTRIALEAGFTSSSTSLARSARLRFPPSRYPPAVTGREQDFRQELLANRGYGFTAEPALGTRPVRVRVVERPAQPIAYVRSSVAGHDRTSRMTWSPHPGPTGHDGGRLGMSRSDDART